jgi:predicted alpha/beta superfamily hydrolase
MQLILKFLIALITSLIWFSSAYATTPISEPLVIGERWVIRSSILKEERKINVYRPLGVPKNMALPVLYMLDGGLTEDFLHIAGLLQVSTANGTTRPFILVGIENTQRRRDLTGPTSVEKDRKIAPNVGASDSFRTFIRNELLPEIARRYQITAERAIIGESLAGLFILETLIKSPDLFDTYIALDPSLWWNGAKLLSRPQKGNLNFKSKKNLYIGSSKDGQEFIDRDKLAALFEEVDTLNYYYEDWFSETHATIYHPAALKAFRVMFPTQHVETSR